MAICCKVDLGIAIGATDCDKKIVAGAKDLRIVAKCSIASTVIAACPSRAVTSIVMSGTDKFFKFDTRDETLQHEFEHTFDKETGNVTYSETVTSEVALKNESAMCALDKLFNKEVVALVKEKGTDGKWIIVGLSGGLFLTSNAGKTGLKKADNKNTVITLSGELDDRWLYVFDTDQTTTDVLIDSITA